MTPQGDSLPPESIPVVSEEGAAVGWPPKRLDRLDRTVGFHHHTQRGSPMRHPIREEPHG